MNHSKKILFFSGAVLLMCSCRSNHVDNMTTGQPMPSELLTGQPAMMIPKARIYRMSGDCTDLVPITLGEDGTVISYPAPTDLNSSQMPLPLEDGWYLDRRGIGIGSVLTTYTYTQYEALPSPPSPAQLIQHISRDCHITHIVELPMTQSEASADTIAINNLIKSGLRNCKTIISEKN